MIIDNMEAETVETNNVIPDSGMRAFVRLVEEHFKDPENRRKFEEWKKKKAADPA